VAKAARLFLASLPLRKFAASDENSFRRVLDEKTERLRQSLPDGARDWGLARKCLNIFLRDAFYNAYLRTEFGLSCAEPWYEVPLDSQVARRLERVALREGRHPALPKWTTLKDLQPTANDCYQAFALELAQQNRITARVHLDLYLFRLGGPRSQLEL
jgi:hypothetical protein